MTKPRPEKMATKGVNLSEGRGSLLGVICGLMSAEHLGDVHDEILLLHDLVGLSRPEGNFEDGWTESDWLGVEYTGG